LTGDPFIPFDPTPFINCGFVVGNKPSQQTQLIPNEPLEAPDNSGNNSQHQVEQVNIKICYLQAHLRIN
jgi:hypothetical protein